MAVGVAPINVTTGNYFWLQTWGPAAVQHAAATPAAAGVKLGTLGGVVAAFDATTNAGTAAVTQLIGKNFHLAATATQCNPIMLTVIP